MTEVELRFCELQNEVITLLLTFTAPPMDRIELAIAALRSDIRVNQGVNIAVFDNLATKVTANGDVQESAIVLLNGLSQLIKDAAGDPARLAAITNDLDSHTQRLAAAVIANTPLAA